MRGSGALQTGLVSRRVRGQVQLQGLAHARPPMDRFVGLLQPFAPDHMIGTAALMTIGLPAGFDTWAGPTPNAEPRYLHFSINFWFEVFGEHLIEVRLMGDRARAPAIDQLQPERSGRAYSILVVVADGAGNVATGSDFWKEQIAPSSALNTQRLSSGLQGTFDVAIKHLSDLGDLARTTASFQATIDAALVLCRRGVVP